VQNLLQQLGSASQWLARGCTQQHSRWDPRPPVTFPAAQHHRPSTTTKLYSLVKEAGVSEWLAISRNLQHSGWDSNPWPLNHYVTSQVLFQAERRP